MNITNKTILITGGGSGIGLEIAKLLNAENKVIIAGRNKEKLDSAAKDLANVSAIQADITNENDLDRLVEEINNKYGGLNILINNAGHAYAYQLSENSDTHTKAKDEFETNYFAPIRLTEKLLPLLKKQDEAAVINVSSIVSYTPGFNIPTYSDSKAALHSYTQSLRHALAKDTQIKVFELMPPLVDTEFSAEIGGKENGIHPSKVAEDLVKGLQENTYEIRVGNTELFYNSFFASSKDAFSTMNQ
ncbi:putative oxidoreductase [Chryseobacterium sp. H1D6B]|uniref:SDR family oxidoreductase n=1 Tax=Chryseobacterium sp. H1D6B TaxID=2940588 RepID=UPI0015CB76E3|nr:SDR family NAD(P)-dependent oxidoreductase [Chryseobacterium sp. H1D6B]MDH6250574.1 putative oxidoreductase [Chryseobacterium sp. H1D6B]